MNEERLKELTGRAERAKQLAADIERLNKADPFACGVEIRFRPDGKNSSAEYIEFSMLQEVLDRGRKSLIADKEAELETILGWAEIPAATVPGVFIPQFSVVIAEDSRVRATDGHCLNDDLLARQQRCEDVSDGTVP